MERVHTMGIVGHIDISPPGQCPVMFCIAADHSGGTQHYDYTGAHFTSCVHGNLSHWDPCQHCGHGDACELDCEHLDTRQPPS